MSLVVNKSVIPMKLILQYDWMLHYTLFYISMLLDKLLVYLLMLSKEFCRCYTVFYPPHVKCSIFSTYINRLLTFLYTYVHCMLQYTSIIIISFYVLQQMDQLQRLSFRKIVIVCKSLESWQKAAAVSSGVSFQVKRKAKFVRNS